MSAVDPAQLVQVVEPEPHEVQQRWVILAARGAVAGGVLFFVCFLYAFFYLRSVNTHGQWQPRGVSASSGLGAAIAFVAVGMALALYGAHRASARGPLLRVRLLALGLVLALATVALQIVEYAGLGFGPSSGGYASVFVGWTATLTLAMLGTALWLEILLAGALRARHDDPMGDLRMTTANTQGAAVWTAFMAVAGVVTWIVLYLV